MQLQGISEFPGYRHDRVVDATCLARVVAPTSNAVRAPISLAAVLDGSGSMHGKPLELVKSTVNFLVHQMGPQDSLCIVLFQDTVDLLLPMTPMTPGGKAAATAAAASIRAAGSTNLSGGLFAGVQQQNNGDKPSLLARVRSQSLSSDWDTLSDAEEAGLKGGLPVKSVYLFTDGAANVGIADRKQLNTTLSKLLGPDSRVHVSCFGFGASHDDLLLEKLAQTGKGMYYNIPSDEEIPIALAAAFGGLMSTAAQNLELKLTPQAGVVLRGIKTPFPLTSDADGSTTVAIGDIYCEESKDVLLELQLPATPSPVEQQCVVAATVTYMDVEACAFASRECSICVDRQDQQPREDACDPQFDVVANRNRCAVLETMELANAEAERRNFRRAQQLLLDQLDRLRFWGDKGTDALRLDICTLMDQCVDRTAWQSCGSRAFRGMAACHGQQRRTSSNSSRQYSTRLQEAFISQCSIRPANAAAGGMQTSQPTPYVPATS